MSKTHIAYVASECQPFFTSGGLGEVIGSLPKSIVSSNKTIFVDVYLPYYTKLIKPEFKDKLNLISSLNVSLAWRNQWTNVYMYQNSNVNYYFIDNEYYFNRDKFYGYYDDAERFAFFCKASIEVMKNLNNVPDIIHAHDWQAALSLIYLRTNYYNDDAFVNTKRVFTVHNIEYQGIYSFDSDIIQDCFGINNNDGYLFEFKGNINLMKGAMESANMVTTVSESYAEEIKSSIYAHELEDEVNRIALEGKLCGILNGIGYDFYNPETDKALFKNYSIETITDKFVNKEELQKLVGLPVLKDVPVISMVSRLVWHKGLNIFKSSIDELMKRDIQMIILGTGDSFYENVIRDYANKYPNKLKAIFTFNGDLSRKIYAGSDLFLMPSETEPCGLSQMIAARYGTLPMVRRTGGLKDSIIEFNGLKGNGFSFDGYDSKDLVAMCDRAIKAYKSDNHLEYVKQAMLSDFSWMASAKKYIKMYKELFK